MENKTLTCVRQEHLDLCWKSESTPSLKHGCPISMYLQEGKSHTYIYIQAHVEHTKLHYFVVVVYLAVKLQPFNNKASPPTPITALGESWGQPWVWDVLGKPG